MACVGKESHSQDLTIHKPNLNHLQHGVNHILVLDLFYLPRTETNCTFTLACVSVEYPLHSFFSLIFSVINNCPYSEFLATNAESENYFRGYYNLATPVTPAASYLPPPGENKRCCVPGSFQPGHRLLVPITGSVSSSSTAWERPDTFGFGSTTSHPQR